MLTLPLSLSSLPASILLPRGVLQNTPPLYFILLGLRGVEKAASTIEAPNSGRSLFAPPRPLLSESSHTPVTLPPPLAPLFLSTDYLSLPIIYSVVCTEALVPRVPTRRSRCSSHRRLGVHCALYAWAPTPLKLHDGSSRSVSAHDLTFSSSMCAYVSKKISLPTAEAVSAVTDKRFPRCGRIFSLNNHSAACRRAAVASERDGRLRLYASASSARAEPARQSKKCIGERVKL